ncbi:hypothetical protein NKH77_21650 [Streptomyces sp. M19]
MRRAGPGAGSRPPHLSAYAVPDNSYVALGTTPRRPRAADWR